MGSHLKCIRFFKASSYRKIGMVCRICRSPAGVQSLYETYLFYLLVFYLTTVSGTDIIAPNVTIVSDQWIVKSVEGSPNCKYFSGIFPEGLRRSTENHSQDSQSAGRDSNPEIPSRLRRLVKHVLIRWMSNRLQRKINSELSEISRSRFVSAVKWMHCCSQRRINAFPKYRYFRFNPCYFYIF